MTSEASTAIGSDDVMSIRDMCHTFGVTARTLRFYEAKELLAPIRHGQKRLFTRRDRARLKLILKGKRFGFSLEEIRQLLDLYDLDDQQHTQFKKTYQLGKLRLADMERQRDELIETIDDLKSQLAWGAHVIAAFETSEAAE